MWNELSQKLLRPNWNFFQNHFTCCLRLSLTITEKCSSQFNFKLFFSTINNWVEQATIWNQFLRPENLCSLTCVQWPRIDLIIMNLRFIKPPFNQFWVRTMLRKIVKILDGKNPSLLRSADLWDSENSEFMMIIRSR